MDASIPCQKGPISNLILKVNLVHLCLHVRQCLHVVVSLNYRVNYEKIVSFDPLWSHTCIGWLGFWRTLSASPALEAFACSCVCDFTGGVFFIFCFYNFQITKMLLSLAPSPLSLLIIATLLKVSTSHSFFPSKCPAFPPQQNFDWGKFAADTWYKKL